MKIEPNHRTREFVINVCAFRNEAPTTEMTGPLEALESDVQEMIDNLRRNIVTYMQIGELINTPFADKERQDIERSNRLFPYLKESYNHAERVGRDKFNETIGTCEAGASTYDDDAIKLICHEIKNSSSINAASFVCIEDSTFNLKHLTAAISENSAIKEIYLELCGDLFITEIKKIADNRPKGNPLKVIVWKGLCNVSHKSVDKPTEIKSTFFSSVDCWQVIDGFIAALGVALLALAVIAFEVASLPPLGLGVGVVGAGLLSVGLYLFFSPVQSSSADSVVLDEDVRPVLI